MTSGGLLSIEPLELKFTLELRKQVSCTLQLSNKTENNVAFKVKTTNPKKYCVRPNTGIVLPQSTCDVIVTMQAQKDLPADMNCKDKFLLQSVIVSPGAAPKDITAEMFSKDAGHVVEESKLRVIYLPPAQPPSPVAEGSEEGSPSKADLNNGSESRKYDSDDQSSEARPLSSKLSEERAASVQQANIIRQEVELMKGDTNKTRGAFLPKIIIVIGLVGLVFGYLMKRSS